MPSPSQLLLIVAFFNIASFTLFGADKFFAKSGKRRISEKALLSSAALAATPGALLGMVLFNHKTSKPKFRYGVPAILAAQAGALYWISFA